MLDHGFGSASIGMKIRLRARFTLHGVAAASAAEWLLSVLIKAATCRVRGVMQIAMYEN